ncbi:hypothetical protein TNCV_979991 [Trichonephila clavipes]|uniref:Uncharacterized protein n=1 Tax=Trichonephila clavipes TaxID=2585209 RepID=A0A8X6VD22_TRICX|nr:hypothetical protein TNCV_979991 [Trichonephila clavipes]
MASYHPFKLGQAFLGKGKNVVTQKRNRSRSAAEIVDVIGSVRERFESYLVEGDNAIKKHCDFYSVS